MPMMPPCRQQALLAAAAADAYAACAVRLRYAAVAASYAADFFRRC